MENVRKEYGSEKTGLQLKLSRNLEQKCRFWNVLWLTHIHQYWMVRLTRTEYIAEKEVFQCLEVIDW